MSHAGVNSPGRRSSTGVAPSWLGQPLRIENDKGGETRFREIVDSSPTLIHTGRPDGYLEFFNRTWLDFTGQPLEGLFGLKWASYVPPDGVRVFLWKLRT